MALAPEKLSKVGDAANWRDWAHRARTYIKREIDPSMKAVLLAAESRKDELKDADFNALGISKEWDEELKDILSGLTLGEPFRMVRSAEIAGLPGKDVNGARRSHKLALLRVPRG